jgi:hypothetical protein
MSNLRQQQQQLSNAKGQKLALFGQHAQLRALVDRNKRAFQRVSDDAGLCLQELLRVGPCRPAVHRSFQAAPASFATAGSGSAVSTGKKL